MNAYSTYPTLRALWNIPHIIQIPDPMPAPPEVLDLIHQRIAECRIEILTLDPHRRDYEDRIAHCKHCIFILEHKIEEIQKAFPHEKFEVRQEPPLSPSGPKTSDSQSAPDCPAGAQTKISVENNHRNEQPIAPEPTPECTPGARECTTGVRECTTGARPGTNGDQEDTTGAQACTNPDPPSSTIPPNGSNQNSDPAYETCDAGDEPDDTDETQDEADTDETEEIDAEEADFEAQEAGFANDAQRMAEAAAELKAQITGRNRFDNLTAAQQAAIVTLLDLKYSLNVMVRLIARPAPDGMDFKISKSGLGKFYRRYKKQEADRLAQQNARATADLLDKSEDPDKAFTDALQRLLRMRALSTASDPNAAIEEIDNIITSLTKIRKQSLAERKQLHAEKKSNHERS